MNTMDSLYAVTRLGWHQCRENPTALALFKKSKGFKFPLLHTFQSDNLLKGISLPLGHNLPPKLVCYIFGPHVQLKEIPAEWIHYILATLCLLEGKTICLCCNGKFLPTSGHY